MERTIKVTGKGKLAVKPDLIRLKLNMEGTARDYEATLSASAKSTEALKDVFEEIGLDRKALKTLFFNVDTVYESYQDKLKGWKRKFGGYKFIHRMKIEFEADNELLGKALYALTKCPVKPEFTIEYTVADMEKCKNELLGNAIIDSKEKARVLTEAAGVKLCDIITIDYSWDEIEIVSRPVNEMMLRSSGDERCAAPASYNMDIEVDDIVVTDTVTVVWGIE